MTDGAAEFLGSMIPLLILMLAPVWLPLLAWAIGKVYDSVTGRNDRATAERSRARAERSANTTRSQEA